MKAESLIAHCARAFGLGKDQLRSAIEQYNEDYSAYGNEIYETVGARLAHWINYLEGNWFAKRLDLGLAEAEKADLVVDLGFSVPYAYSSERFVQGESPRFLFVDKHPSAAAMYALLVEHLGIPEVLTRDQVLLADLECPTGLEVIEEGIETQISQAPVERILIVLSEVVEHLENPGGLWSWLGGLGVKHPSCQLFVTLPVGRRIPSHTMEFASALEAEEYLRRHIDIGSSVVLSPKQEGSPYLRECVCVVGTPRSASPSTHDRHKR